MKQDNKDEVIVEIQEEKRYSFCTCGLSEVLPYCDNAHREHNDKHGTHYKSLKIRSVKAVKLGLSSATWKR